MIELTDRAVDDVYRHGIADLIAHLPRPAAEVRQRRLPVLVAIVGVAIPIAALALAAIVVIAGHAQHSSPTGQSAPSNSVSKTEPLGQTIGIGATLVPATDVTIRSVMFTSVTPASSSALLPPSPANGLYAVAEVQVSIPGGGVLQAPPSQYTEEAATVSNLVAELQTARLDNDVVRAAELEQIIAKDDLQLSKAALALMPFHLVYVATDGESFEAWGRQQCGRRDCSVGGPRLSVDGLASFEVVFDVRSGGGVIVMTDLHNRVVGRWQAPAE